ncbi:MAG: Y-family DNA polymerase [Tidjanibacter sp.]|nr:Y-family DNA polymerase [Tidjanibacter sp.]
MYALVDCNNFFVSCERLFRPDLEGRAVVVLSNNDGCAVSRSNEAKQLGIRMGQPYFEFAHLEHEGKVTVFSSNYILYGDISRRVQSVLREASPDVEVYSIDESFLLIDEQAAGGDFDAWAKALARRCKRLTGIPVGVGVAPTKTLAKIASKLCKQYPALRGGCYMHRPEDIEKVLNKFPLSDVWGIGRRYNARFTALGMHTAADFAARSAEWVRREMGVSGLRTWRELHGVPCITLEHAQPKQSICCSRSFASEISSIDDLQGQLATFVAMAAEKLRKQHSAAQQATVFILTNRHRTELPQHYESRLITFATPTDDTLQIGKAAAEALRQMWRKGVGYKKAGIVLSNFCPRDQIQADLFDTKDHLRSAKLMKAIDTINATHGAGRIHAATQSTEGIKMSRKRLSPSYTSSWNDIIVVNANK